MSEPARRSALEGHYRVGRFGADSAEAPGVVLAESRPRSMIQINGAPEVGTMAAALGVPASDVVSNRAFHAGGVTYAWNGPGQWLAVSAEARAGDLIGQIETALRSHGASTTDLSHARTAFSVAGGAVGDLLAKLCPIDIESMQTGDSAVTMAGPFNVQIVRVGDEEFRLYVFRSFGLAMWELLLDEAAEFSGEVVPAG